MKGRRLGVLQVAVSGCALGAVVWWGLQQRRPELPDSTAAVAWIVLAVGLYTVGTALRGERWWRILRLVDVKATRPDVYALTAVGYMGNNVLPARAGDVLRVFLLSRETGGGMPRLLGTVVAERLLDVLVLGGCLLAVVYTVLPVGALPTNQPLLLGGGLLVLLALAAIVTRTFGRHPLFDRARAYIRPLADAPRALISLTGVSLVGITVLIWAFEAAVYVAVGRALGLDLTAVDALYLVCLANCVAALPAAPGSLGTFEAAVVFGLTAISKNGNAVSYLLMLRLVLYGPITIAGLVVLFVRFGGGKFLRRAHGLPSVPVAGPVPSEVLPRA
jgi:uncharacterized membrane protein YbhN (UPF0104 family)